MTYDIFLKKVHNLSRQELINLVIGTWSALSGQEWDSEVCDIIADAYESKGLVIEDCNEFLDEI